jgi:cytochrome c-type biogenesis protein CcmE
MGKRETKLLLLTAGILLCVGFMLFVGMNQPGGMVYYLTVGEFLQSTESRTEGFRISGRVEQGSVLRSPGGRELKFAITDGTSSLSVHYLGSIPDAFAEDADVVVEGRMGDDRTFEAHTLIAKCPSKYEAAGEHPEEIPIGK